MDTTKPATPYLDAIREALQHGDNILISGRPHSGITTFLDTLVNEAAGMHNPGRRMIILEDNRRELHVPETNVAALRANIEQESPERGRYILGFSELLDGLMNFGTSIDSLVFGDINDQDAARALLTAARVGIRGFLGCIHAYGGGVDTLHVLEMLLGSNDTRTRQAIARFIQLIVRLEKPAEAPYKPYIADVSRVMGVDAAGEYVLEEVA
jgi:Flp pilus assembly CpaF family ATPase